MGSRFFYLRTGSIGWVHPQWRGVFYPDDLPDDWMLSYYSTQFRCVFVPVQVWAEASEEQLIMWLQETQEDFRFVLEVPKSQSHNMSSFEKCRAVLAQRALASSEVELVRLNGQKSPRELAERMKRAIDSNKETCFLAEAEYLSTLMQCNALMPLLGV